MRKKNLLVSIITLFLSIGFMACSNDDDSNIDKSDTDNVFPEGIKRLVSIGDEYDMTTFTYNAGKLISVQVDDSKNCKFEYLENVVKMIIAETYFNEVEKRVFSFNIGSNGFATGGSVELISETENEKGNLSLNYKDNCLISILTTSSYGSEDYYLSWENGNITKVVNKRNNVERSVFNATFGSDLNTAKLSFFEELADLDELEYAYYAGLLGYSTKNLLTKSTLLDDESRTRTYTYKFNSENYPTEMTRHDGNYSSSWAYTYQ